MAEITKCWALSLRPASIIVTGRNCGQLRDSGINEAMFNLGEVKWLASTSKVARPMADVDRYRRLCGSAALQDISQCDHGMRRPGA